MVSNVVLHGLIFAGVMTAYLLVIMVTLSPRVWGFSDYPKSITDHVSPQTSEERRLGVMISIPFFILILGFPIWSTLALKSQLGGQISLLYAFLNIFGVGMFAHAADLIILDWLIVGTITPKFVVIAGTEHMRDKEYKDFRLYHAKGHVKGIIATAVLSLIFAAVIVIF